MMMTPEQADVHIRLLHQRMTANEALLDTIHDRLLNSPPAAHLEVYQDHVDDMLERYAEQLDTVARGMSRHLADASDSGRTISEVTTRQEIREAVTNAIREIRDEIKADLLQVMRSGRQASRPSTATAHRGVYTWNQ